MAKIVHFEFKADDPEKLIAFFGDTFGWKFQKWEGPDDYWLVDAGPEEAPGINGAMASRSESPGGTVNIIDVEDIEAAMQQVTAAGGTVTTPKMPVPGMGWSSYFTDPDGNLWGLWQEDRTAGV